MIYVGLFMIYVLGAGITWFVFDVWNLDPTSEIQPFAVAVWPFTWGFFLLVAVAGLIASAAWLVKAALLLAYKQIRR